MATALKPVDESLQMWAKENLKKGATWQKSGDLQ